MKKILFTLAFLMVASVAHAQMDGAVLTVNDYQSRRLRTERVNLVDGIKAPTGTTTTDFGAKGFIDLTEAAEPDLVQAP